MNKRTAENFYKISISQFKEWLKHETKIKTTYTFSTTRTIGQTKQLIDQQQVNVIIDGESNQIVMAGWRISIETTPCNYGSHRYWFNCPCCSARCSCLFFVDAAMGWQCRTCGNLVYKSQQETKTDFWTWYNKAEKIAKKLNPNYEADGFDYMLTRTRLLFPERPLNMHTKTYEKLYQRYLYYVMKGNHLDILELNKVLGKAGLEKT